MTDFCETVEELVTATSSCPATDVIMVQSSSGNGSSTATPGVTPPVTTSAADAESQVVIEAYSLMINTGQTTSEVSSTLVVTDLLMEAAKGQSTLLATLNQMATSVANAEDEIAAADVPQFLISAAQAASVVLPNTVATFRADSSAIASSETSLGLLESLLSNANAGSSVTILRRVEQMVVENADGSSTVTASGVAQDFLLLSSGGSTSMVMMQAGHQTLMVSEAEVSSSVWFKDPGRVAWVLNTESTAGNWYGNFDFESIAQPPGKVLAVGPDGLYELTGATDAGDMVNATVQSGFTDFGVGNTQRVDAMYFGYTSAGRLSVSAETKDSGHAPVTYFLEQRDASAPRNSRLTPGKGMYGRYWRLTIRNVDGADFEIHDATVDVAVSTRRV